MSAVYHLAGKGKPTIKYDVNNQLIVTSSTVIDAINNLSNQNKLIKYTPMKCQNCGAPLTKRVNSGMICEYCDTIYKENKL